jgi:hypothetical protein
LKIFQHYSVQHFFSPPPPPLSTEPRAAGEGGGTAAGRPASHGGVRAGCSQGRRPQRTHNESHSSPVVRRAGRGGRNGGDGG